MTEHHALASQPPEIHDPSEASVPTEPVSRRPPAAPARGRWRWLVALLVVALAATATIAGGILLTGARTASTVARWAPADALVYAELRPDLPGDQRDQLAAFLSAFPGFADRSTLDQKLTEVYDRLVSNASKGKQSYSADVAPWFAGQLGVTIRPPVIPVSGGADRTPPPVLLVAASTDPTKALAWFRSTVTASGATTSAAEASGTPLVLATEGGRTIAGAAPSGVLLVGDEASVKAALARDGAGGLVADPGFQAAMASLPADGLATSYVHVAAYVALLEAMPRPSGMPAPPADLASMLPAWSAATLRAGSDSLTVDGAAPATTVTSAVPDGPTALAARLPASTIALLDVKDVGRALTAGLSMAGSAGTAELEQLLARVGGAQALTGWAGEGAAVVIATAQGPLPGAVALATDPKGAAAFAASLSNLATLAGLQPTETTYAGHTIATVDLTSLARESEASRNGSPGTATREPSHVAVSWTIAGDLVVVGPDPAFVKAILDTKAGSTLADSSRYASMAGRVAASNHAFGWIDMAAVRDILVAKMPSADRTRYEADIAPYLAPLDGAVGAATHDGSLERAQGFLILKRP